MSVGVAMLAGLVLFLVLVRVTRARFVSDLSNLLGACAVLSQMFWWLVFGVTVLAGGGILLSDIELWFCGTAFAVTAASSIFVAVRDSRRQRAQAQAIDDRAPLG